jgi:hypothetical protein
MAYRLQTLEKATLRQNQAINVRLLGSGSQRCDSFHRNFVKITQAARRIRASRMRRRCGRKYSHRGALLGHDVQAAEQRQAPIGRQCHDVTLALHGPELERQGRAQRMGGRDHTRARQPAVLGKPVELQAHEIGQEQKQAPTRLVNRCGASAKARTSARGSTVGRTSCGRSSPSRRRRGAKNQPSGLFSPQVDPARAPRGPDRGRVPALRGVFAATSAPRGRRRVPAGGEGRDGRPGPRCGSSCGEIAVSAARGS